MNELVTNVIHYAYADPGNHEIRIALSYERRDGRKRFTIIWREEKSM